MASHNRKIRITTDPDQLTEGLFGQIILHAFEVLPKLNREEVFPQWAIKSRKYGCSPDYSVIPGLLDINYELNGETYSEQNLSDLRGTHLEALGGDWTYMNALWNTYFRIPERIEQKADEYGDLSHALALHFRGTDKNTTKAHTNPVSHQDMLQLTQSFIKEKPDIEKIFVATDEMPFASKVKETFKDKQFLSTGEVIYWDNPNELGSLKKGDHAILDCLLMARCKYLLKCQSALSGFSKVLNPNLEAYRISASKMFADCPYFPDAYIQRYETNDPCCQKILRRLFEHDWLDNQGVRDQYGKCFRTMKRLSMEEKRSLWGFIKRRLPL